MKQNVWLGGVAAITIALGCGAAAQTSAPSSTQREQTPSSANTISVTGCLQGSSAAVGTTGTGTPSSTGSAAGAASAAADRFMLMNATTSTGAATPGAATTPAPGAAPTGAPSRPATPSASGGSYIIEGNAAELRTHVNQQVQITGRIESGASATTPSTGAAGAGSTSTTTPSGSASAPSTGSAPAAGSQTATNAAANAPRLRVESVKMIAATCTPK